MPSLITTIEENSPLINYLNGWTTGTSATDDAASSYSDSTFMATQVAGASASFVFNGTGVQIFGAKRGNHGPYVVKVDDSMYPAADGVAPPPGLFQQNLFSVDGLKQGRHEVTIINQAAAFLDIDFITWTTDFGKPSDKLFVNTFQDTDPSFAYSSGSAWNTNPKNVGSFLGGSGHATTNPGASFVYTFQVSEGVSLYGPVSPDGAPYTVQLDGGSPRNFTSSKDLYRAQVLLYHANNLPTGQHRVQLTCQPTTSGQIFAVDYANVYTTTPPQAISEGGLSAGSIVGITLSIVGILGVLAALFLFIRRRQRLNGYVKELETPSYVTDKHRGVVTMSSLGPGPATGDLQTTGNLIPAPFPMSSIAPSESDPQSRSGSPGSSLVRPAPTRRSPSPAGAPKHQVRFSDQPEEREFQVSSSSSRLAPPSLLNRTSSSSSSSSNSTSPRRGLPSSPGPVQRKGQPMPLPSTAGRSLPNVPEEELRANRLFVEGRAQDFGSSEQSPTDSVGTSPFSDVYGEEEGDRDGVLPPDYLQATQQYTR